MLTDRRSVLRAIGLLMTAPVIVRAASLMPVRVWREARTGITFEGFNQDAWRFSGTSEGDILIVASINAGGRAVSWKKVGETEWRPLLTSPQQITFHEVVTDYPRDDGFGRQRLQLIGETG